MKPDEPPFSSVGMDYFGPFAVKQGRSTVKRYGVIFVCLTSKAVHIEKADKLDTDACINVIRRFISRRGPVKKIRSDNGTNLVGASKEIHKEISKWNQSRIHEHLLQRNIDWVFNPPAGSHFGGIWERQIRTIRKLLFNLLRDHTLSDETLQTLLCEVESIMNSRPLTPVSGDASDMEALTPNHILLLKAQQNLPPMKTNSKENYVQRRWKLVQQLADIFWHRWTREYLPMLQQRQKWICPQRNAAIGDVVLVKDETMARNEWPLAKIIEVMPGSDGLVRQVRVRTRSTTLVRPVDKLCLLLEAEMPEQEQPSDFETSSDKCSDSASKNVKERNSEGAAAKGVDLFTRTSSRRIIKPPSRLDL